MHKDLEQAMRGLVEQNKTPIQMRLELLQKGFLEEEVDTALNDRSQKQHSSADKKTNRQLATKEAFDRLGYGFATPQFINILFWMSGASVFLVGLLNGIKAILQLVISSVLQEYSKLHTVPKERIASGGLVFGFSFFIMAIATLAMIPWLFAAGFLLGSLGVVTYGDLYNKLIKELISHEKRTHFLRNSAMYGVIITGISMLLSATIIDNIPGIMLTIGNFPLKVHGFLLSFMITSFAFILGSFVLSKIPDPREQKVYPFAKFFGEHCKTIWNQTKVFMRNKYVLFMLLPAIVSGFLQILGAAYYGIFIYEHFNKIYFGGFMNVAILYIVALIFSLFGPLFTKLVEKNTGLAPHLVFGTLLTAILPLVLAKNPHFYAVMAALVCSVVGASIAGTAQGLIAQKIMDFSTRKVFFVTQALLVAIPYMIMFPLGAWFASTYGFTILFMAIGIGLAAVVAPLYFVLVLITNKMRL
ncbi:MFS transporter [Candidatus Woesearchaeota archaeon]|nr:MFS transporter [Candidatus Woesearchaeota archaeon]